MIFVATGVHEHGFDRLVRAVDDLAGKGKISNAFIQTGFSEYRPKHCRWRQAIDFLEFDDRMKEADIVISHGGAGCIASALELRKPTIVVPRLRKYDEHNDDHQLELASVLERDGRALVVRNIADLEKAIEKAATFKPAHSTGKCNIKGIVRDFLSKTAKQKGLDY